MKHDQADASHIHSLDALENFIRSQKALLERTHADIARLADLRKDVEANPPRSLDDLSDKVRVRAAVIFPAC